MPKQEAPLRQLENFLPPGSYDAVEKFLYTYKIHLTITRRRNTILGDYRYKTMSQNHRISINGNLNTFAFLITLIHEVAHLLTFEQFGHKVAAHGREWKSIYTGLLKEFLEKKIFPKDIENELIRALTNPAASSCAEEDLMRVLRKYDKNKDEIRFVEEIPLDGLFMLEDNRVFKRGRKQRKRYECTEVKSGRIYLFSPVHEVKLYNEHS